MSRKTPKLVHDLLEKYEWRRARFEGEIKRCEELNEPTDILIARAEQSTAIMEEILHTANCYHGFQFLDGNGYPTADPNEQLFRRIRFDVK